MSARTCRYGVFDHRCGAPATTERDRPTGETWDVCDFHALVLDRLRANVKLHARVLKAMEDGPGTTDDPAEIRRRVSLWGVDDV